LDLALARYQASPDRLKDRVILVTGASQGIGRAVAKGLALHGATVILLGKTVKVLETVYDEIVAAKGPQPAIYPLNLANATPADYEQLAIHVEETFGALHGLLHNAAMFGALTPLIHYALPVWYQVLQVNLNSAFLLTHALLPLIKRTQDARILFTGASEDQHNQAYWGAYAVSKTACEGLMRVLAEELELNTSVRVNLIKPSKVATALRTRAYPGDPNLQATCLSPESLLPYYLYLLGPDSANAHGQVITVPTSTPALASAFDPTPTPTLAQREGS